MQSHQSLNLRAALDTRYIWPSIGAMLALVALIAVTAPEERTLGGPNARLVYFHGALVWASILTWFIAAGAGVLAFLRRSERLHHASRALGRIGLLWWALYIPVSILAANATWANNSWDLTFLLEPRFQVAFQVLAIGLVALAVQFFDSRAQMGSIANIVVVLVLVFLMGITERVLHPPAPIRDTESLRIQLAFFGMTALLLVAGLQLARLRRERA
ncbi:MAG: hypothetical protein JW910_01110 [Anaerolineae bacterium]|nr:hypothetical protein [Anaerolineae bacterium]